MGRRRSQTLVSQHHQPLNKRYNLLQFILSLLAAGGILLGLYILCPNSRYALAHPGDKVIIHFPTPPAPAVRLALKTRGRHIVDKDGRRIKLASVNWYGASDELFIPCGLDVLPMSKIAGTIRQLGFNSVRLPYSDEMMVTNPTIPDRLVAANKDLVGSRALDVFEAVSTAWPSKVSP
jgi:hypothetical protein